MRKLIVILFLFFFSNALIAQQQVPVKPRILVSTDIGGTDPDDNQSMIHLLMYNELFDIEGLVSSPSYGDGNKEEILRTIDLYEKDLPKLKAHKQGFATPEYLRSIVKQGRHGGAPYKGYATATEGSNWIIQSALKKSDRPLWILIWGGLEDLAQALHDKPQIQKNIKVFWIGGPNKKWSANSYAYIATNFPNLWFIESNASYYGFFSNNVPDSLHNKNYYRNYIKGAGYLGKDYKNNRYNGNLKMGDTPSLLYMMDGNPENPMRENWGGSYVKFKQSPRLIYTRNTTLKDTVTVFSIIEFKFKGPVVNIPRDSACLTMSVKSEIGEQKWDGFYLGNGNYVIRYCPKRTETISYHVTSKIKGFKEQRGSFVVDNIWPGKPRKTNYILGANWYTDRSNPELYDDIWQGGKTVLKWRNDVLLDWAQRWNWLREGDEPTVWKSSAEPLKEMEELRQLIKAPQFKNAEFLVTNYGAIGDGKTKNTEAFKKAIEACSISGGGRVVVPPGVFLTGAIYLESNVNLHLSDGATILFSRDPKDYPIVFSRWEGMECMNYSSLIYAYGEENIAISGNGILDGNADNNNWWNWNGSPRFGWKEGMPKQTPARNALHEMMHRQTDPKQRVFGEGHYLRPNMLQPYNCRNVRIADVKMVNSPMWFINPVLCKNVIVEKVRIVSHGPNNDGCDPESCKNVLIKDCHFDTGDDCIAIKSGRDEDGRRIARPAENHIIEGCEMKDGHGGVVIGSEIAGGARNIYAINCNMDSPNLDRILRLKTSSSRGGVIENVFMKDVKVGAYKEAAIHCNMFYEAPGKFMPTIRNVWVENLDVSNGGKYGIFINAYKESPVQNLVLVNCNIRGVDSPMKVDHVKNLQFRNVQINGVATAVPDNLSN